MFHKFTVNNAVITWECVFDTGEGKCSGLREEKIGGYIWWKGLSWWRVEVGGSVRVIAPHVGNGEGHRNQFRICKKNTNRPPSPTAVCVCGCVLCNFKFFGGNL